MTTMATTDIPTWVAGTSPMTTITPSKIYPEYHVAKAIMTFVSPFLIFTGFFGNTLAFAVLRRKSLRESTSSFYLQLVAVADNCVLLFGLLTMWIGQIYIDISRLHPITCKLRNFLFYSSMDVATWLIVAFTIDRFVAVWCPLRRKFLCTVMKAKICAVVLVCLATMKNAHIFWTRTLILDAKGNWVCGNPTAEYKYYNKYVRPWVVFGTVQMFSFVVITFCNAGIIYALHKSKKRRARITTGGDFEKNARQMTIMCLGISCAFLLLNFPSVVLLIGKPYWSQGDPQTQASFALGRSFGNQFINIHHSCNFFLYCMTGHKFRTELAAMFGRKNRVSQDSNTMVVDHTPPVPPNRAVTLETVSRGHTRA